MSAVTTEELAKLRIPLTALPGFNPAGLVVRFPNDETGIVVGPDTRHHDLRRGEWEVYPLAEDGWQNVDSTAQFMTLSSRTDELEIDAADSAAADRLARWLAARVGLEVGCTAPSWARIPRRGGAHHEWILDGFGFSWVALPDEPIVLVPSLADLDLDDSRFVDRLALARVAVHVGGTP